MFFGQTPQETRQPFFTSWKKHRLQEPCTPLEQQIIAVILDHPEYHTILEHEAQNLQNNYFPELGQTNPFLHMGLHLALREQITLNRPAGLQAIYKKLCIKKPRLEVEHRMIDVLAQQLWQAQRDHREPDEQAYLQALKKL